MGRRTTQLRRFPFKHLWWRRFFAAGLACFVAVEAAAAGTAAAAKKVQVVRAEQQPSVIHGQRQCPSQSPPWLLLLAFVGNPPASQARISHRMDLPKLELYNRRVHRGCCGAFLRHADQRSAPPRMVAGSAWVGSSAAARGAVAARSSASLESTASLKGPPSTTSPSPAGAPLSWLDRVEQLRQFKAQYGHAKVPKRYNSNEKEKENDSEQRQANAGSASCRGLGAWVQRQRQVRAFVRSGFVAPWCVMTLAERASAPFLRRGGFLFASSSHLPSPPSQRRDRLSQDQVSLLDELGFCWSVSSALGESVEASIGTRFPPLPRNDDHGAPRSLPMPPVDSAVDSSRHMDDSRAGDGVTWWDQHRALTVHYASAASVPKASAWGAWLRRQRHIFSDLEDVAQPEQDSSLVRDQGRQVESVDPQPLQPLPQQELYKRRDALRAWDRRWDWTEHDHRWNDRFAQLVAYRHKHGDCCVPVSHTAVPGLGPWVSAQRKSLRQVRERHHKQERQGRQQRTQAARVGPPPSLLMKPSSRQLSRIRQLDSIGFVWCMQDLLESQWQLLASSSGE
jgi:Helicase associated domain